MNKLMIVSPILALLLAGCTSEPQRVASSAPCKVAPIEEFGSISSFGGPRARPLKPLDQEYAQMQLRSTPFYRRELDRRGYADNTLADSVRDCY